MAHWGRFLLATWAGGGNVPPMLGIGRELARRGHHVTVLGNESQRGQVEEVGLVFSPYARVPDVTMSAEGWRPLLSLSRAGMAEDIQEAVAERAPEALLIDCTLSNALTAAELAGVPTGVLVHLFPSFFLETALGPAAADRMAATNQLRSRLKLEPVDGMMALWSKARLTLVTTLESLDWPAASLPASTHYVGPIFSAPSESFIWRRPWGDDDPRPLVLVSFSGNHDPGLAPAFQNVLDALADSSLRVLATTGPAVDPAGLKQPANAVIQRFVPHAAVLPYVSVVVSHGGHATTMAALAHGLPLLILPLFGDQPLVAQRISRAGAGLALAPKAGPSEIRRAVEELSNNPIYRVAADKLAAEILNHGGATLAASLLEGLLLGSLDHTEVPITPA